MRRCTVTSAGIAAGAVGSAAIAADAVGSGEIAADAVGFAPVELSLGVPAAGA